MIDSRWFTRAAAATALISIFLSPLTLNVLAQTVNPTGSPTIPASTTITASATNTATSTSTAAATLAVTSVATSAATTIATTAAPTRAATSAATLAGTAAATSAATTGSASIKIDGSKIVSPVVNTAVSAYVKQNAGFTADVQVSGTSNGFDKLCSNTIDAAMANAGITDQQISACTTGKVSFVELLLGFNAGVIVTNTTSKTTCLTPEQIATLLTPAAAGKITDISQLAVGTGTPQAAQPLSKIYAGQDTNARTLISTLVPGQTLRTDLTVVADGAAALDQLAKDTNGIAIVTLAEYQKAQTGGSSVRAVQIGSGTACTPADAFNLEQGRYAAGQPLYLYVNVASLDHAPIAGLLNSLVGKDGQALVTSTGFTPASDTSYTRDQTYLSARQTGRTFSRITSVNIPSTTAGVVTIDGAPEVHDALQALTTAFQPLYGQIALNQTLYGNDEGFQKLCAGTIDLIGATRQPTADESAACQKGNISPMILTLGSNGVVLLVNAKNTWATCLTLDQIGKLIGIASDSKVKKWSDVDSKFPTTDLLLLSPADGDQTTDLLLLKSVKGEAPVARTDMTSNSDPLYRATGTANVAGAVTWMSYADYKKSTAKTTLVQIDGGKGCVTPGDKTLADSTYPIAEPLYLFLSPNAFSRPEVKAFVWYLLSDDALAVLQTKANLLGLDRPGFLTARDKALTLFSQIPTQTPTIAPTLIPTIKAP